MSADACPRGRPPAEDRLTVVAEDGAEYGTRKARRRPRAEVGATLRPGQKGTKRLLARFGAQLFCVRYRYDRERRVRLTTIELVVNESPWEPAEAGQEANRRPPALVEVRLAPGEMELRMKVRGAGGFFDTAAGVWVLRRDRAFKLGLRSRMRPSRHQSASTPTNPPASTPIDPRT